MSPVTTCVHLNTGYKGNAV